MGENVTLHQSHLKITEPNRLENRLENVLCIAQSWFAHLLAFKSILHISHKIRMDSICFMALCCKRPLKQFSFPLVFEHLSRFLIVLFSCCVLLLFAVVFSLVSVVMSGSTMSRRRAMATWRWLTNSTNAKSVREWVVNKVRFGRVQFIRRASVTFGGKRSTGMVGNAESQQSNKDAVELSGLSWNKLMACYTYIVTPSMGSVL